MFPQQLGKEERYLFTREQVFKNTLDLIHGFVMRDYSINMHVQEFFEINIVMQGSGMHYIEKNRLSARRGDVFIIPPQISHGYVGGEGFDVYHVLVSNKFMEKYMADLQRLKSFFLLFKVEPLMRASSFRPFHLTLSDTQFEKTEALLHKIEEHSKIHTPAVAIIRNSLAMILITMLCEIYTENVSTTDRKETQYDEAFATALALIHERYYEKISISLLAKTAQLSRSSFLRRFQEICKMSPAKYLTQQRIEAAEHMLANTGLSISDIASKTGFYDTSHFIKIFTAETGRTPSRYRKEHTNPGIPE